MKCVRNTAEEARHHVCERIVGLAVSEWLHKVGKENKAGLEGCYRFVKLLYTNLLSAHGSAIGCRFTKVASKSRARCIRRVGPC